MRFFRSQQLPWWIVEICRALESPSTSLPHGAELGLIEAVDDALAWATDPREYEGSHEQSWKSMISDAHATTGRLGTKTQVGSAISSELHSFQQRLQLPPKKDPDRVKKPLAAALQSLLARFLDGSVVAAAWQDLIDASRDDRLSEEDWAWRRNLFLGLARRSGRAVDALALTLTGILDDRLVDVTQARVMLKELDPPELEGWPSLDKSAGLAESDRLTLCERMVSVDPVPGHCIVCVGFDHGELRDPVLVSDRLGFYPAARVRDLVGVGQSSAPGPIALAPPDVVGKLPSAEDEIVAIIDLGTVNAAQAAAIGAANCEAVIAVVNNKLRSPRWHPMTGHILIFNGRLAASTSFTRSDHSSPRPWAADPTQDRLEDLAGTIDQHLPIADPVLQSVIEASHRLSAAKNQTIDLSGCLLLAVRAIEEAKDWSSGTATPWYRFAADRFAEKWAEHTVSSDLFVQVGRAIDHSVAHLYLEEHELEELDRIRTEIIRDHSDATFDFDVRAAYENLQPLAELYPRGCGPGRQIASLQRNFQDGPHLGRHLVGRASRYQRLLDRTRRCRNSAAHAGPLPPATVESVSEWADTLATTVLNMSVDALLTGTDPDPRKRITAARQEVQDAATNRRSALMAGGDVAATLFG